MVDSPTRHVVLISAGASHAVALLSDKVVCSWGRGEDGQLGHGDAEDSLFPTLVRALDGLELSSITCGADHTTAYSESDLEVYSWGWGDFGRLGHGNSSDVFTPQPIKALQGIRIKQIACGDSHCLAVTMEGIVQSWGRNQNGQLGLGTNEDSLVPQKVQTFQGISVKMVAAGAEHSAAVTEDGDLFGWGWGRYGNLGIGDRNDRLVPEKVSADDVELIPPVPRKADKMVLEKIEVIFIVYPIYAKKDKHKWCILRGEIRLTMKGGIGIWNSSTDFDMAKIKISLLRMTLIACGWRHTITVSFSGALYTYGWSKYGQLGHGDFEDHLTPHKLESLKDCSISQISGGWRHTMALTSDGRLYGWGWNKFGQLGVGDNVNHCSPIQVKFPQDQKVVYTSCGWRHTLAVTEIKNVFSWGRGTNGQLGHGDTLDRNTPKIIEALSSDGSGCSQIPSSRVGPLHGKVWVSPSERYALVPDKTVPNQATNLVEGNANEADVPENDVKRLRH